MVINIIDVQDTLTERQDEGVTTGRVRPITSTVWEYATFENVTSKSTFYFFSMSSEKNAFCIENVLRMEYTQRWLKIDFEKMHKNYTHLQYVACRIIFSDTFLQIVPLCNKLIFSRWLGHFFKRTYIKPNEMTGYWYFYMTKAF